MLKGATVINILFPIRTHQAKINEFIPKNKTEKIDGSKWADLVTQE